MPLSTEMRKNKSKVRFVESSFGEKVGSTFPVVQYALCLLTKISSLLFVYEKQIQIVLF
jgi:hypothetical protein